MKAFESNMLARTLGAFVCLASSTLTSAARASACGSGASTLTCGAVAAGSIGPSCNLSPTVGCSSVYATCGAGAYENGSAAFLFTCPMSGPVTLSMTRDDCDVDLFVLDGTCQNCAGSGTSSSVSEDVTFSCVGGESYEVILERAEAGDPFGGWFGASGCSLQGSANFSIAATCFEVCADNYDNDGDGYIDCLDLDCGGYCPEICDNRQDDDFDSLADCFDPDCDCLEVCVDGSDNDRDGLVDCADPECTRSTTCCDADGDGHWRSDAVCLGEDCNDDPGVGAAISPSAIELSGNDLDEDCDGYYDCFLDADADGHGGDSVVASRSAGCTSDGLASTNDDCDDADARRHPSAVEACDDEGVDDDCDGYVDEDDPEVIALGGCAGSGGDGAEAGTPAGVGGSSGPSSSNQPSGDGPPRRGLLGCAVAGGAGRSFMLVVVSLLLGRKRR